MTTESSRMRAQVESLKADSDAEVARTNAQLDELRTEVAAAVQSWSAGGLDAQASRLDRPAAWQPVMLVQTY